MSQINFRSKLRTFCFFILNGISAAAFSSSSATASATEHFLSPQDFQVVSQESEKGWDPADSEFRGEIPCQYDRCVSIDEAVDNAVKNGFPTKEGLESVFRARQQILVSLGSLLPRLEFSLGNGVNPTSIFSTISNLLGFLLPGNWFTWKESKLLYAAERASYTGLLQDQVSNTEVLYYNVHRIAYDLLIYYYYADHLDQLIQDIKKSDPTHLKVTERDILQMENLLAQVRTEAAHLNLVLKEVDQYDLALALGLTKEVGKVGVKAVALPDLAPLPVRDSSPEEFNKILGLSSDVRTLKYLKRAAHYTRMTRMFSFLSANGTGHDSSLGIDIGFDYIPNIRISSSEIRSLDIRLKEMVTKIEVVYHKSVDSYNDSVDLFKQYAQAKEPNRSLFYSVLSEYNTRGTLDTPTLLRTIDWALKFELGRSFMQHFFLITQSQLKRLLLEGERYQRLNDHLVVPANQPLSYRSDGIKLRENRDIDHDIGSGALDLNNP